MRDFDLKHKIRETVDEEKKTEIKQSVREQKGRIAEGGSKAKTIVQDVVETAEQKAREFEEDVNIEIEETENAYLRLVLYFRDKQITTREVDGDDIESLKVKTKEMVETVRSKKQEEKEG